LSEINWKGILWFVTIVIILVAALCFVTASAISDEEFSRRYGNYTGAPMASDEMIAENGSVEVHQMDTIYWYDVADLALVEGWYGKLYHEPTGKIVDVSSFSHKIFIDPDVFPIGEWDQWSDYTERGGNTIAFFVAAKRPFKNVTESTNESVSNVTIPSYVQPIPVRKVTDILVARGDPLSVSFKEAKLWLFGTKSGYFDFNTVNGAITLNKSMIQALEPGTYTLLAEFPNNKTNQYNMKYDSKNDTMSYFDPNLFRIVTISFSGLDPQTRLAKFRSVRNASQDAFYEYRMQVQDPSIEIASLDQQYINETVFAQTVRGYTNVAIGSLITFKIDPEKTDRFNTFSTQARGSGNPGEMRWFEMTIPLLWENFNAGHHTINAMTEQGGTMTVGFDVHESPEHSYIPNNTIKYVNGSEWKEPVIVEKIVTIVLPTPTPITIIQTVKVPPPQASVDEAQSKAVNSLAVNIIVIVVSILVCIGIFMYWRSARCRRDELREKWK
jgi:hypothetical protein